MKRIIILTVSLFWIVFLKLWRKVETIIKGKCPGTCIVLYYHNVANDKRASFARQMRDLVTYAEPVASDYYGPLQNEVHHVIVTFDDGFVDALDNALPELEIYNIPSTWFIPTGFLGKYSEWIKDTHKSIVVSIDRISELKGNHLVTFGSHCVTHRRLVDLTLEEAQNEILASKKHLESVLRTGVTQLSFPHGSFNCEHVEMAKTAGYKRAFSISPVFADCDQYLLGRIRVDPADWRLEFRLKLLGAYSWLSIAHYLKRKILSWLNNFL